MRREGRSAKRNEASLRGVLVVCQKGPDSVEVTVW